MKKFYQRIRENEYTYLLLAFLVPVVLMYTIYACMTVFPFGRYSCMVLDMNGQYVSYFEKFRDVITSGGSLIYSWERALGGEFMGIFTYYLASPLSLIVCLFPKALMTEALLCLILVKMGLCGFFCGLYLHKTRRGGKFATVFFSVLYAMCAYGVLQSMNTMWIDAMYLLPLMLLGIERIIKKGKISLFVVSFALIIATNYYIGYMMAIFCVVYFFCRYFAEYPLNRFARFAKTTGRILWGGILAVSIAGVFILTAWYSLGFGKTTFASSDYTFKQNFDFLDFFVKLLPGSYDTVRPEGLPVVYCGVLSLILLPIYYLAPSVRPRRKICATVLLLVLLMSMNISTVDLFWHGLSKPNWLNYRYSFAFCFIMIVMAYDALCDLRRIPFRSVGAVCLIELALVLVAQKFDYEFLSDYYCIWFSAASILLYLAALYFYRHPKIRRNTACAFMTFLLIAECVGAGYLNLSALDSDVHYGKRDTYVNFQSRVRAMTDQINADDDTLFRMEKTVHRKVNDPLSTDMKGLSHSTSTLNASVIDLLQKFGYASRSHWSKYLGGTPVTDSLLGLKYIINDSKDEIDSKLYNRIYDVAYTTKDLIGYENPYTPGILYTVADGTSAFTLDNYYSPFERMNRLISAMVGSEEYLKIFVPVESEITSENCSLGYNSGHKKYTATGSADAVVTFDATAPTNAAYYAYFPSDYPREVNLKLNHGDFGTYYGNETRRIVSLGSFEKEQEIRLDMTLTDECVYIRTEGYQIYYLDEALFNNCMMQLKENTADITDWDDTHITATVKVAEGQSLLFTSIPYDEGWNIEIDGQKVAPVKLMNTLIGIDLSSFGEGEHTLTMRYLPQCLVLGALISLLGILLFVLTLVLSSLFRKHRLHRAVVAAGDDAALPEKEETEAPPAAEPATEESVTADEPVPDGTVCVPDADGVSMDELIEAAEDGEEAAAEPEPPEEPSEAEEE